MMHYMHYIAVCTEEEARAFNFAFSDWVLLISTLEMFLLYYRVRCVILLAYVKVPCLLYTE